MDVRKKPFVKLSHQGLILIAVPLFFQLVFIFILYRALDYAEAELQHASHAKQVVSICSSLGRSILSMGILSFAQGVSSEDVEETAFERIDSSLHRDFRSLEKLFHDQPESLETTRKLESIVDRGVTSLVETKRARDVGDLTASAKNLRVLGNLTFGLSDRLSTLAEQYQKYDDASPARQDHYRVALKRYLLLVVLFNIALAIVLAFVFNRVTARRLSVLVENVLRFKKSEQLAERLGGNDDISRLDSLFHEMAVSINEAARQKKEFMAMIAHDLRSPLTSVHGSVLLLAEVPGEVSETGRKRVRAIERDLDRLINLINDLLDIEKLDSGKMETTLDLVPVAFLLENAVQSVRGNAARKRITIHSPDTDAELVVDANQIVRVLVNLIANAIKFSPEGSTIEVTAQPVDADWFEFSVSDQGPGIPDEHKEKVFERFHQVSGSKDQQQGTGLGLAICKTIVEQHGGVIGLAEQSLLGGSTFVFELPIRR
jgi:signal transduction histidine kinase